tara:strand:- start:73 stop:537 length:465 start_codon:yes stop_codon:yes gene_type:complete
MPGYKKPMMGHKKPKMAHGKKKPMMSHGKKAMMYNKKPIQTDLEKVRSGKQSEIAELKKKYPNDKDFQREMKKQRNIEKTIQSKKPQFNAELKKAAKQGKLDGSPKFKSAVEKSMMYKPQMNKGPYMMNPGSKEIDTPGTFRADSKAMMFKKNK